METMEFCPNCGQRIEPNAAFCGHCGSKFNHVQAEAAVASVADGSMASPEPESTVDVERPDYVQQSEVAQSAPAVKKRGKAGIIALLLILLVVAGGFFGGSAYFSKQRQVQALRDEVVSGNASKMTAALISVDGKQVSKDEIVALKRLFLKDSSAIKSIEDQIDGSSKAKIFTVKKAGKYFGIFDRYRIQMGEKSLAIDTNISSPAFYLNNKSVAVSQSSGTYKIAKMTPGLYDLKVKGEDGSKNAQVKITAGANSDSTELNIEKIKESDENDTESSDDNAQVDDTSSYISSSKDSSTSSKTSAPTSAPTSDSMVGTYHGNPDLTLNADGTYTLGSKSGSYTLSKDGSDVSITFNQNGGGSITESYDYDGHELYSDKYSQGWIKY